jgi:hypothetical protein
MPVIFVHGITVRQERFPTLLDSVRKGLSKQRNDLVVEGFYWGDMASSLRYSGASIPGFLEGARAVELAQGALADETQLSMLLLDEPLLELRLLKDVEDFDPSGAGFIPMPPEVEQRNQVLAENWDTVARTLAQSKELAALAGMQLTEYSWQNIVKATFDAAGKTERTLTVADLLDPLTRSLTASLYREIEGDRATLDTAFVWSGAEAKIQELLEAELGGQRGWLGDKLKGLAGGAAAHGLTLAMRHGLRRRIMEAISLFVGDVLAYMAKREEIQAALEKTIAVALRKSDTPLWLVGHSLGGILSFDHCLRTARKVERLMTVGSQVGLFAELGAFPTLKPEPGGNLASPASIEKWLNVYDPDDILSFLAQPVMTKAVDIEFDTKAPFPVSHSEYWKLDKMYARLLQ